MNNIFFIAINDNIYYYLLLTKYKLFKGKKLFIKKRNYRICRILKKFNRRNTYNIDLTLPFFLRN